MKFTITQSFTIMVIIAASCMTLLLTCSSSSEQVKLPDDDIKSFFKLYKTNPDEAIKNLFSSNDLIDAKSDDIAGLRSQLKNTVGQIGEFRGYDKISQRYAGESLVLYSYMVKYDVQPLRFTFVYYKPDSEWRIHHFKFDTNIEQELERSAEIYLHDETYQSLSK